MQTYALSLIHESGDRDVTHFCAADLSDAQAQAREYIDFFESHVFDRIVSGKLREFAPKRLMTLDSGYGPIEYTVIDRSESYQSDRDLVTHGNTLDNAPALVAEGVL